MQSHECFLQGRPSQLSGFRVVLSLADSPVRKDPHVQES